MVIGQFTAVPGTDAPVGADVLDVCIIGAGVSGLCVAWGLQRAGFTYRILEQADDLGGTWRDNTYPGCGCDIPAPLYSYSFAQRADWSRLFASQPEILNYLREVAKKSRIDEHITCRTKVVSAHWQESTQIWVLTTTSGAELQCRNLVSAIGALHTPRYPDIRGRETFGGTTFHSNTWDHTVELPGKRVAVIGNGASAIQFVPQIAPQVGHLTVFQRTPSWIVPKSDVSFSQRERLIRRLHPFRWYARSRLFWIHESRRKGFTDAASEMSKTEHLARSYLSRKVADPRLRQALTPDYAIGCKRLLISNDYYPALCRDNVTLETSTISAMTADGIVTVDGRMHPVDVVIYATGFDAHFSFAEIDVIGRGGERLSDRWAQGREAYLATTVSGFPNYFVMLGPNSALGHNSQIFMIEAQARYIVSCLRAARRRRIGALDVRPSVEKAFNDWLQGRLSQSVWETGGCSSWYHHPGSGKNTVLWPSSTISFWRKTHRVRLSDYECIGRIDHRGGAAQDRGMR
jgi:cation diffusion facilitator CzcD-associated flavoprotein CzcO